jgi:hypothetical protein
MHDLLKVPSIGDVSRIFKDVLIPQMKAQRVQFEKALSYIKKVKANLAASKIKFDLDIPEDLSEDDFTYACPPLKRKAEGDSSSETNSKRSTANSTLGMPSVPAWAENLDRFNQGCTGLTVSKSITFIPCFDAEYISSLALMKVVEYTKAVDEGMTRSLPVVALYSNTNTVMLSSEKDGEFL